MTPVVRPPTPDHPLEPGHSWVAVMDPDWRVPSQGIHTRCRRTTSRVRCQNAGVADLNRGYGGSGYAGRGARAESWWAYCADHLYGRWVEDGAVMCWSMRPTMASGGAS